MRREGYTLVELMMASTIFVLVVSGLGTFFVGVQRLAMNAFADAELTVRTREFRERLLFHVEPTGTDAVSAGILSGSPVNEASKVADPQTSKITMAAYGADPTDGKAVSKRIELVRANGVDRDGRPLGWIVNESSDSTATGWLRPGGFGFVEDGYLDTDLMNDRHLLFFNVTARANGRIRRERIVVPLFGTVQVKNSDHVFNDR